MSPSRLWQWSTAAYAAGHPLVARTMKTVTYVLYRAILPAECRLGGRPVLLHRGLGVVVHPNTRLGSGVVLAHAVTIGASSADAAVIVEDEVFIGAGSLLVAPPGRTITIGRGVSVGAGCVVTTDVPAGGWVRAPRSEIVSDGPPSVAFQQ